VRERGRLGSGMVNRARAAGQRAATRPLPRTNLPARLMRLDDRPESAADGELELGTGIHNRLRFLLAHGPVDPLRAGGTIANPEGGAGGLHYPSCPLISDFRGLGVPFEKREDAGGRGTEPESLWRRGGGLGGLVGLVCHNERRIAGEGEGLQLLF